jgi:hypothetical protein
MNKPHTKHNSRNALFPCEIAKRGISAVPSVTQRYIPLADNLSREINFIAIYRT